MAWSSPNKVLKNFIFSHNGRGGGDRARSIPERFSAMITPDRDLNKSLHHWPVSSLFATNAQDALPQLYVRSIFARFALEYGSVLGEARFCRKSISWSPNITVLLCLWNDMSGSFRFCEYAKAKGKLQYYFGKDLIGGE